ncbi:MAG: magnesium transporter [Acholeplasma sp.]
MDIRTLLSSHVTDKELKSILEDMHSFDIVSMFDTLEAHEIERIKNILSTEQFADVLSYLEPEDAAIMLQTQSLEEQVLVVQNLEPDDAADIINEYGRNEKNELINELDKAEPVVQLMDYKAETAGSYMNNDILMVDCAMDFKSTTKAIIKSADDLKSVKTVFVVDSLGKYLGQINLKALIRAKAPRIALDILESEPILNVYDDVDTIVKHIKHYGAYDIGVVDDNQKLLGAITTDDLLDIYRDEAVEDIEKLSFLPDTDIKTGFIKGAFKRLPWLLILMIISIPLALITSNYEEILASVVILALFQPLLLDSGGNVASQTLAVTLVGLTYKEGVTFKDGLKETLSGVISGFVMSAMAFIAAYILSDMLLVDSPLLVAIVVSLSLWLTVIISPIIGFIIPMVLAKLKFDPATAAGPFITTIIDILCLVIYFGLATFLLGGQVHV